MTNFTRTHGEGDDHQGAAKEVTLEEHGDHHGHDQDARHGGQAPAHGHGHGADFVPHVLPLKTYFGTWIALLALTAITVGVSYINLGTWNIVVALVVATVKAVLVALLFMHLFFDLKFHAIIFSFSLIFLGVFIAFTMYDTETRGRTDAAEAERPVDIQTPFSGNKSEASMKKRYANDVLKLASPTTPGNPAELLAKPPHSN